MEFDGEMATTANMEILEQFHLIISDVSKYRNS